MIFFFFTTHHVIDMDRDRQRLRVFRLKSPNSIKSHRCSYLPIFCIYGLQKKRNSKFFFKTFFGIKIKKYSAYFFALITCFGTLFRCEKNFHIKKSAIFLKWHMKYVKNEVKTHIFHIKSSKSTFF